MNPQRAQTTLDFAIAMGVFLLAVAFVFTFIPSLTAPFLDGSQDRTVVADRTASHVAEGALADPDTPYVVQTECANVLFDNTTDNSDVPAGCGYSGDDLHERVGLDDRFGIRIEVLHIDPEATGSDRFREVCFDAANGVPTHEDVRDCSDPANVTYTVGGQPGDDESVVVARRVVTLPDCEFGTTDGCDAKLRVQVW